MKVNHVVWFIQILLCCSITWVSVGGEKEVRLPPGAGPGDEDLPIDDIDLEDIAFRSASEDIDAEERRNLFPYVASPIRKFDKEGEVIYEEHSGLEFPTKSEVSNHVATEDSTPGDSGMHEPESLSLLPANPSNIAGGSSKPESPVPIHINPDSKLQSPNAPDTSSHNAEVAPSAENADTYSNESIVSERVELLPGVQLVSLPHRQHHSRSLFSTPALRISLPSFIDAASNLVSTARFAFGKNSFLTGFGLGFMAFGLKKLLLPVFIGMQIVKSVLVAMFLPTILSHVGKLVGKGVSSVASGSSAGQQHHDVGDFEFKDQTDLDQDGAGSDNGAMWTIPSQSHATLAALNPPFNQPTKDFAERYTPLSSKLPGLPTKHHGSFYTKDAQQDYKIFHKIPNSSQLLAHYDPFYSPLLSRLDSVFQQLGTSSELCRQRLVCDMYSNPAKFAPYSNLVSAQLSRELNELRKPSSDNPEILRFFRYMKAAKDGQDGQTCQAVYSGCIAPTLPTQGSPMIETFNQINKLVHARKLNV